MAFLEHERDRASKEPGPPSARRLSSERLYLQIAALRAFYNFAEAEKLLPKISPKIFPCRAAGNGCPRRCPTTEIERLLEPESPATPRRPCATRRCWNWPTPPACAWPNCADLRLEQLHLDAGFVNVIGKGNKERVVPVGRKAVAAIRALPRSRPAQTGHAQVAGQRFSDPARHAVRRGHALAAHQAAGARGPGIGRET